MSTFPTSESRSSLYILISAVFISALISANLIAVKLVVIAGQVLPAAIVIFPISYIAGDILTEVYGFKRTRSVIWLGFVCNLLVVLAIWIGSLLPPAEFWKDNVDAYETILGYTPRLLMGSFIAYLAGESRTIGSTLVGQGLDSAIFITIAFAGEVPELWRLIWIQWAAKVLYEIVATPITYGVVTTVKRRERLDSYDWGIQLNPIKFWK